jgi:hypothetical protein
MQRQSFRSVGDRAKPSINGQPRRDLTITIIDYGKRGRDAVNPCVDARRLSDEVALDAQARSAALLASVLFEHINGYSAAGEADSRREPGERSPYDCDVTCE